MKLAYDFITEIDLGMLGFRDVDVSYSYDKASHVSDLMSVYLMDGHDLGPEITDYLSADGENLLHEEMHRDLRVKLSEEAAEAEAHSEEMRREHLREAAWEIQP